MSVLVARHVIVDAHYVAGVIPSLSRRHIHVIPQGIVLKAEPRNLEERFIHKTLLSVGVFSPRMGQHRTVESLAPVVAQFPDALLTLAGISMDAEFLDLVKRRPGELDVGDAAMIVDAAKPELQELLANSTLFLTLRRCPKGSRCVRLSKQRVPVLVTNLGAFRIWSKAE
jgi:hypothetical protein